MITLQILFGIVGALLFSLAMTPIVLKVAASCGLYDVPDGTFRSAIANASTETRRRVHRTPIPRLGGVAIFISYVLTVLALSYDTKLNAILLSSLVIFIVGFLDDLFHLPAWIRLVVQSTCATAAITMTGLGVRFLAFSSDVFFALPPTLAAIVGVFIIVGAINAINMIDGLDGLAGGIVLICLSLFSFLYFLRTHELGLLLYMTFPMVGAILGFLKYNTHPASIFMGDCGSNWLGFMIGVLFLMVLGDFSLSLNSGHAALEPAKVVYGAPHVPLISVVLCMALPIIDSACVIFLRLKNNMSPMSADNRHFHHTLLKLGFSHSQSVTTLYFIALVAGITGVIPTLFPQYPLFWMPYACAILLTFAIPFSPRASETMILRLINLRMELLADKQINSRFTKIMRHWESLNRYLLYAILIITPALAGSVKREIGYAAAITCVLLFGSSFSNKGRGDVIDSLLLSLATVVLLVANNQNNLRVSLLGQVYQVQFVYNGLFILLFISSAIMILTTAKKRYLVFTPSDFLLLTTPMLLLLVPEPFQSDFRLNIICLRSLIVFVALRNMSKRKNIVVNKVRMVCLLALLYVSLTSLLDLRIIY